MGADESAQRYVDRWFWTLEQLAESVGAPAESVLDLIHAGCAPGAIYVRGHDGSWWSALDGVPAPQGRSWYSPGAAWGLRRCLLAMRGGTSPLEAAEAERTAFIGEFVGTIGDVAGAELAFPDCFAGGRVDPGSAAAQAAKEWQAWLRGGYGVCLRLFTARTCLAKESLRAALLRGLDERGLPDRMLRQAEALAVQILPFAPWQRSSGTPGRTIDRLLATLKLGCDLPYAGT